MKMETPFSGALAVLGVRGRSGHFLSLRGTWTLAAGAVVYHRPMGLDGHTEIGTTVIGHIIELHTWAGELHCTGYGVQWLSQMLRSGAHALSMEMHHMQKDPLDVLTAGQVRAALLVKASNYSWKKEGS